MRLAILTSCLCCWAVPVGAQEVPAVGNVIQLRLPADMKLKYEEAKVGIALRPVTPYSDRNRAIWAQLSKDKEGWILEHSSEWKVNGEPLLITVEARIDLKSIQTEPLGKPKFLNADDQKAYENALRESPPEPRRYVDITRPEDVKMRFWRLAK